MRRSKPVRSMKSESVLGTKMSSGLDASRRSQQWLQLLLGLEPPSACWTVPPMAPSAVNCFPMAPSLSRGPPIFWAVPPTIPSSGIPVSLAGILKSRAMTRTQHTSKLLSDCPLLVKDLRSVSTEIGVCPRLRGRGHSALAPGGGVIGGRGRRHGCIGCSSWRVTCLSGIRIVTGVLGSYLFGESRGSLLI